jgi:hypothetical protein
VPYARAPTPTDEAIAFDAVTAGTMSSELFQWRDECSRWASLPGAAVAGFFASLGWHHGFSDVWHLVALGVVCVAQAAYPTMLGWTISVVPFALYFVSLSWTAASSGVSGEVLVFAALGILPVVALLIRRPRGVSRQSYSVAVVIAMLLCSAIVLTG